MAQLDKTEIQTIRAELDQAIAVVAQKHGMKFSLGTIRFDGNQMRTKLTGDKVQTVSAVSSTASGTTITNPVSAAALRQFTLKGIDPNKKYSTPAGIVMFTDYVPRRYKFPYSVTQVGSGKKFKLSESHILFITECK